MPRVKLNINVKMLKELYLDEDLSEREIAKRFGCSKTRIHNELTKYNIKKNRSEVQKTAAKKAWITKNAKKEENNDK